MERVTLLIALVGVSILLVGCSNGDVGRPVQNLMPGLREAFTVEESGLYGGLPAARLSKGDLTMYLWCHPLQADEGFVRSQEKSMEEHRYNEQLKVFRDVKKIPSGGHAYHFMHSTHTCGVVANQALNRTTFDTLKRIVEEHGYNYSEFKEEKYFDWVDEYLRHSDREDLQTPGWATHATRYQ